LAEPLLSAPQLDGFKIEQVGDKILDVAVPKESGLNQLFKQLSEQQIQVLSLKNKTNRLEQLFMDLVDSKTGRTFS